MAVFTVLISIKDSKGKVSTSEINIPNTFTIPQLSLFASSMAVLINPLITGQIVRIGVALDIAVPGGLRVAPLAGSDVEEGAKFQFLTSGGFYTGTRIATFDESNIAADSRQVDLADTDVASFVNAMIAGLLVGGGVTATPVDKRGEDITALDSALESFQSSRAA